MKIGKPKVTSKRLCPGGHDHSIPFYQPSAGIPKIEHVGFNDALQHIHRKLLLVGDAIEVDSDFVTYEIKVTEPYKQADDEFDGHFVIEEQEERFRRWTLGYSKEATDYIRKNIESASTGGKESCKVGFVSFNHDLRAQNSPGALCIRPLNHLVTTAFNRYLARDRLKDGSFRESMHDLWADCLRTSCSQLQSVQMNCPSQLFIELIIITLDGRIPVTHKSDTNSVYAIRNEHGKVKTCGVELGSNWQDLVHPVDGTEIRLDLEKSVVSGLKREYPMPGWDTIKKPRCITMVSLVIQALHLNSALVGYCIVPYSSLEMMSELKGRKCGGLDHSELDFKTFSECYNLLRMDQHSTEWHGTVMARFQLLADHEQEIRAQLDAAEVK